MISQRHIRESFFSAVRRPALLALSVLACATAYSVQAFAGVFAPTPCDINGYYKSLESRAWMEAQREITQNQNLIFKPDSVLEYTCFDGYLSELADHAKDMFSETTRWGTAPPGDMATSLTNLIGTAMAAYDTANFNYDLLGGRFPGSNIALPGAITAGSYTNCRVMDDVWMHAKCIDFIDDVANDGFFTFQEYASSPDKRVYPPPMTCAGSPHWNANMNAAYAVGNNPWQKDKMKIYYDLIYPSSGCGTPFETGLEVTNSKASVSPYIEHVCIVPGCHYEPTSRTAGNCQ